MIADIGVGASDLTAPQLMMRRRDAWSAAQGAAWCAPRRTSSRAAARPSGLAETFGTGTVLFIGALANPISRYPTD